MRPTHASAALQVWKPRRIVVSASLLACCRGTVFECSRIVASTSSTLQIDP